MDVNLLIDGIVRQTTVLIAQLATQAGNRAPLARTANQVFLSLVQELKQQGLTNKVIADMFGLALRTYHDRVQRLSESQTFRGRSLWEAVLQFVQENGAVAYPQIMQRFRNDDDRIVRSVLGDLVDSGLLSRTGKGDQAHFQSAATTATEAVGPNRREALAQLVLVVVHRFGPLSRDEIQGHLPLQIEQLDSLLELLINSDRIAAIEEPTATLRYHAEQCVIPVGSEAGWEAAVFDHYQALVTAICAKLELGRRTAAPSDSVGGSTYTFDLWEGHPLEDEVAGHLQRLREESVRLRRKVESHNAEHAPPSGAEPKKFISYVGQTVIENHREE